MATKKERTNPFAPGTGTMPAFFSGRKEEIKMIDLVLDRTKSAYKPKKGDSAIVGPIIVLTGPRGIGKTLLLSIAMEMALGKKVQVADLTQSDFSDPDIYLSKILPEGMIEGFFKKHKFKIKGGISDYLGAELQLYSGVMQRLLHEAISERLKKGPLLILVDEAHALPDELLVNFYQQIQQFLKRKQPLGVMLAGTPSIKRHRWNKGLTFAERTEFLEFNLLSESETKDAFVKSLSAVGMKVEPKALAKLTKWSDNYPYFLQMVGFSTWNCIENTSDKKTITVEDVNKGIKLATEKRNTFYTERVVELQKKGLYYSALQVINLFKKTKGSMNMISLHHQLINTIKNLDESSALALEQDFMDLGFLYRKEANYSPGIPSLFDYMEKLDKMSSK